jgi:hypothetical protein
VQLANLLEADDFGPEFVGFVNVADIQHEMVDAGGAHRFGGGRRNIRNSICHYERSQISVGLSGTPEKWVAQAQPASLPRSLPDYARSAAIKAVLLVVSTLIAQCSAARVQVSLLGVKAALLAPVALVAVAVALLPTIPGRRRRRFAIHGSTYPLQDIARILRLGRPSSDHQSQRKDQQ